MATIYLNKCRKCGAEFNQNINTCPKCGTTVSSADNQIKIGLLVISAMILWWVFAPSNKSSSDLAKEQLKAEQKAADDIKWNLVFTGEEMLKKMMRDPDSLEFDRVLYTEDENVCYTYRAKNGFGGMNKGAAIFSDKGLITNESKEFEPVWEEKCDGKSGEEVSL